MEENRFFDRDISWLQFNRRVLQEAADAEVPLYERIKFLAIYSSNLDEFFRVRVSSLRSLRKMKDAAEQLQINPKQVLKKIKRTVYEQQEEFGRIYTQEVLPELRRHNVILVNETEYTEEQKAFANAFFLNELSGQIVTNVILEESVDVFLENRQLYLVVQLDESFDRIGVVGIPVQSSRFVTLPKEGDNHCVTFIDDIVRLNIPNMFPGHRIYGAYSVKTSRDAELYLGDEFTGDLIARLEQRVQERSKGLPIRFLYDKAMPSPLLKKLRRIFNISKYDVIPGARYHNFNDFFSFPNPTGNPSLHDDDCPPQPHPALDTVDSLIEAISKRDYLLHFPYHKYDYVPGVIEDAANNPDVEAIKITLYRVANQSQVTKSLLKALKAGKKVFAFIEAKARFDEESNLRSGRELEKAGARVRYSFPGIKVHSKLLLISTKSGTKTPDVAYLGTGNFNEKTAKLYADHALLTANQKLTTEVGRVFEMLEGRLLSPQCKKLMVSPFTTRTKFTELVDNEIRNARAGKEAWMILKMNSLHDRRMIDKLYEASAAGVRVRCIVRGICCLIPGVSGLSENITVTSIIDRFLEHARVYIFAAGGKERMYLASADWMTRNLDRRVEVVFPIADASLKSEIRDIIDIQLADNTKARVIDEAQSNGYVQRQHGEAAVRAQRDIYDFLSNNHGQTDKGTEGAISPLPKAQ